MGIPGLRNRGIGARRGCIRRQRGICRLPTMGANRNLSEDTILCNQFCGDTKPVIIPCHHGSATFYLGHEHSGVRGMVLQSLKTITRDPLLMHESHSPMKAGYLTSPEAAAKGQSAGEITTAPRFTASPSRLCMAYLGHRFILHTCSCHLKPPRISDLLPSRGI